MGNPLPRPGQAPQPLRTPYSPPPPASPQWGAPPVGAPAGYVPHGSMYGQTPHAAAGARKAIGILMWLCVGAYALFALAAFSRKSVWDGLVEGDKTLQDVDNADNLVGGAVLVVAGLTIAIAILLAVWSQRAVSNGVARGASANPGLASGSWFIPVGWYVVPFVQLRKALGGRGQPSLLTRWQLLWVPGSLLGTVVQRVMGDIDESSTDFDDVSGRLRNQAIVLAISTVLLLFAAISAHVAMRHVDEVTAGEPTLA